MTPRLPQMILGLSLLLLSACSALSFGIANFPARFSPAQRTAGAHMAAVLAMNPGYLQRAASTYAT